MFSRVDRFFKLAKARRPQPVRKLWNVNVSSQEEAVILKHQNSGETLLFPSVWLRDNCQCSSCFNQTMYSRMIPFKEFKSSVLPQSVSCVNENTNETVLEVKWPDKHESKFRLSWLKEHSFDEKNQNSWLRNNYQFTDKVTWNVSNFEDVLRHYSYEKIMTSDVELLKWLLTLNRQGIAILQDMGTNKDEIEKLANRIGYSKTTTYGKHYMVEAKGNTTNAAYRSEALNLHVDLPYYEYIPSVNLLHFVVQSPKEEEGTNQLVDGLEICKQLKQYDANMYKILATVPVEWTDKGSDSVDEFYHVHRAPVICENSEGAIIRINLSQPQRDPQFSVSLQQANEWYKAMNTFLNLAHHSKNMVQLKMNEGDLLSFDNTRLLHGRSGFTTERSVAGAYLDWDVIHSKIRVLCSRLGLKNIGDIEQER